MTVRILALSGSARRDSLNRKLLEIAIGGARDSGASVTVISLADYPLPLYDGDLEEEQGAPENALALQRLLADHDGLLIASPEHNGGYTAVLKNAVDWISRTTSTGESGVLLFSNKVSAIISASPGPMGGLRSALAFRGVLEKLGSIVIPQSFSLGSAHKAFEGSAILDERASLNVRSVGAALADVVKRLSA
ncbi:NADPH-dependent FMN reductase [Paraburkholderia strydomiana]|uniref:NADPH-dependent FMN reductase n=1 Tax=Paraburkholderia strydomiana TaxID=1245417 RepID=UPI0028575C4C|nr:NAD(P)H-dependent oxidoreductase [Paraburkholderia strydomiana]MDR7008874.1 NAD(P)H-dependent FMN reductase [Paraburkholderia strydomiana]